MSKYYKVTFIESRKKKEKKINIKTWQKAKKNSMQGYVTII